MLTESQLVAKRKWKAKNKERIRAYMRDYYAKNTEKVLAINKKWLDKNPEKHKAACHNYYEKHKAHITKLQREWDRTHPEQVRGYKKKWIENNPEARKAHNILNNALKSGAVKKQPCACGKLNVHAHHDDYSKPLDVLWVCPKHHAAIHKERDTAKCK